MPSLRRIATDTTRWAGDGVAGFRREFALDGRGVAAVAVALAVSAVAVIGLGGLTDDVTERDGLAAADPRRLQFFVNHRSAGLVHAAKLVTDLGNIEVLVGIAILVGVVLWFRGAALGLALAPVASLALAGTATAIAKPLVDRSRPPVSLRLITETEPSFPSGHSTDATALFVTLGLVLAVVVLRRPLWRVMVVVAGVALGCLIGLTRLVLGVHWPTDVLAGWALGTAVALLVVTGLTLVVRLDDRGPDGRGARHRLRSGLRVLARHRG